MSNANDVEKVQIGLADLNVQNDSQQDNTAKETSNDPMKSAEMKRSNSLADLTLDKLVMDYNSIELSWKSTRKNCMCSDPLDSSCAKLNCSRCGEIYCERCAENGKEISNSVSSKTVFVCSNCVACFSLE